MRHLFIVDPLASLKPAGDTSIALMRQAQALGDEVWACEQRDLAAGPLALHRRRIHDHAQAGGTPAQRGEHVAQRRGGGGSDDADGARELMRRGVAKGGMAAKLEAALGALARGVARVRIGAVSALTDDSRGTVLTFAGVSV